MDTVKLSETFNAARNIEIKARIGDLEEFERKREIAMKLTKDYTVIKQRDVFFNVTAGRLKLRYLEVYTRDIHSEIFVFDFDYSFTHRTPSPN